MKALSGAQAVAEAIKICKPDVIAAYPITPQTPVMETIAKFVADGDLDAELIRVESEHSAMSACIGAQATGVQAYTATSSQGLALMHEMLFVASGMRLPIVMTVVNRALSSPLNIWNDQQDSFAERDSGWIQLYVENAQEAFDTHIQAFKIARESETPVMVCMDGYVLSHTYEPVEILSEEKIKEFIPPLSTEFVLNPTKPMTLGPVGSPKYYMHFKKQQHDAMLKTKEIIKKANREFGNISGRTWGNGLIEKINLEGKEYALITIGSLTGTARVMSDIGIIKIKSLRPFPFEELQKACVGLKAIGIVEKDISLGSAGALYHEVKSALYDLKEKPKVCGFIAGLGGRDITPKDIEKIVQKIKTNAEGIEWLL